MIVAGVKWFTQGLDTFGIVWGRDEHTKQNKAYIGIVSGHNEDKDIKHVVEYGVKIFARDIKELHTFLTEEIK